MLSPARWGSLRRVYIGATRDRSILPTAQTLMQDFAGDIERHRIDAGHAPQVSRPAKLAALLDIRLQSDSR